MTWTYSGDPSTSAKDAVRFRIGDTDADDQQISDEEISWLLTEEGSNIYAASAQACDGIAAKYARLVDQSAGELSVKFSQRQTHYTNLAAQFRAKNAKSAPIPFAGGISKASKESVRSNEDRVRPAFRRDMHSEEDEEDRRD